MLTKKEQRLRRSRQTRIRIATQGVARLTVNRTNLHIYASVISGDGTKVLAAASTAEVEVRKEIGASGKGGNVAAAQAIGKRIAEKAKAAGVSTSRLCVRVGVLARDGGIENSATLDALTLSRRGPRTFANRMTYRA